MTKNFIKMCIAAEEIQAAWKPKEWDRVWDSDRARVWAILPYDIADSGVYGPHLDPGDSQADEKGIADDRYHGFLTWLPRQEDLQGMIDTFHNCPTCLSNRFGKWYDVELNHWEEQDMRKNSDKKYEYRWTGPKDLTEAWLAFVMHEKYGKKWDGEGWMKP